MDIRMAPMAYMPTIEKSHTKKGDFLADSPPFLFLTAEKFIS